MRQHQGKIKPKAARVEIMVTVESSLLVVAHGTVSGSDGRLHSDAGNVVPNDLNTNLRFGFLIHDVSRLRRMSRAGP